MANEAYQGWAILELMGHRRLAGQVSESEQYGARMIRIDVPGVESAAATQFYGGGAIYCLTPCSEETARALATRNQPAPVQRWELPAATKREENTDDGISGPEEGLDGAYG